MRLMYRQGLFLPQGHQNDRGEEYAEGFETGADLAQGHAQQRGRGGCGSNQ
jgi:hypothetical protein